MAVAPGTGQLTRWGQILAFATRPFHPLTAAVASGHDGLGYRLTALVADPGSPPPPFLVIDLAAAVAYQFGPLALIPASHPADATLPAPPTTGAGPLLGPFAVDVAGGLHCWADATSGPAPNTDLQAGTVPAGGFALLPCAIAPLPSPTIEVPPPSPAPAVEAPPVLPSPTIEAPPPMPPDPALPEPAPAPDLWDPLADPAHIDLATLGSVRRSRRPTEPPSPIPSVDEPHPEPPSNSTLIDRPGSDDTAGHTLLGPPVAPTPGLPARLRLDDGTVIEVVAGAQVGRWPDVSRLPDDHQAVIVVGTGVAASHWELTVSADALAVRSAGGDATPTRLRLPGWPDATPVVGDGPVAVLPGTTVHFGDRWAVIER